MRTLTLGATFNDSISKHWTQDNSMAGGPNGLAADQPVHDADDARSGLSTGARQGAGRSPSGEPLWKSGKVTMNAPSSAGLVQNKIGERPASLLGNNVAAFSLDLTPDGAAFMEQTLVGRDGHGATDLTPIQVVYELTMAAKLPPASMYIKFNTQSVYHTCQELFHEHDNCSDDYFTSENMMSTAIEAGLVTVKIDAGGMTDPETLQMLTEQPDQHRAGTPVRALREEGAQTP